MWNTLSTENQELEIFILVILLTPVGGSQLETKIKFCHQLFAQLFTTYFAFRLKSGPELSGIRPQHKSSDMRPISGGMYLITLSLIAAIMIGAPKTESAR